MTVKSVLRQFLTAEITYFQAILKFRLLGLNHRAADNVLNNWSRYL